MQKLGILHTGIRGDEKLIIEACEKRNLKYELIDIRNVTLDPLNLEVWKEFSVFLERSISTVKGNATIEFFSNLFDITGIPVVNDKKVMNVCSDKFQTSTILEANRIKTAKSILVFDEITAKQAVNTLGGYPAVIKSRNGSWGRLIAKVNDDEALEAILDHKSYMGPDHSAVIVQEYVKKPGRDIRAFIIDNECIAAIYRTSEHWITNTARGGKATNCELSTDLKEICSRASIAIGGGILALDLFETNDGLIINEINHTMEFKNSEAPTGVSISGAIVDYCKKIAKQSSK